MLADKIPELIPWGEAEEASFKSLKESLVQNTVNHSPDWKQAFYLETDASGEGIGAVLTQRPRVSEEMVKEHLNRKGQSVIAKHINENHFLEPNTIIETKVLNYERNPLKRKMLEAFQIKKLKPNLNLNEGLLAWKK